MSTRCVICGMRQRPDNKFCGRCGARFGDTPKKKLRPLKKKLKTYTKVSAITPCDLWHIPFLERAILSKMWLTGRSKLKFCGCPICKQAFRELIMTRYSEEPKKVLRQMELKFDDAFKDFDITQIEWQFVAM